MIRVGIIGGGQLGMMTIEAKFPSLPVEFVVLEQSADCPAAPISNQFIAGSLKSEADIRTLAEASDVLTWEIEHINVDALVQLEKEGNKGIQKQFFQQHNIPTAHFALCDAQSITEALLSQFPGEQIVIKTRTGGYDGKGVAILNKSEALQSMPFSGNI